MSSLEFVDRLSSLVSRVSRRDTLHERRFTDFKSEARTKLAAFFNILLEPRRDRNHSTQ